MWFSILNYCNQKCAWRCENYRLGCSRCRVHIWNRIKYRKSMHPGGNGRQRNKTGVVRVTVKLLLTLFILVCMIHVMYAFVTRVFIFSLRKRQQQQLPSTWVYMSCESHSVDIFLAQHTSAFYDFFFVFRTLFFSFLQSVGCCQGVYRVVFNSVVGYNRVTVQSSTGALRLSCGRGGGLRGAQTSTNKLYSDCGSRPDSSDARPTPRSQLLLTLFACNIHLQSQYYLLIKVVVFCFVKHPIWKENFYSTFF